MEVSNILILRLSTVLFYFLDVIGHMVNGCGSPQYISIYLVAVHRGLCPVLVE